MRQTIIRKIHPDSIFPTYGSAGAACMDVSAYISGFPLGNVKSGPGTVYFSNNGKPVIELRPGARAIIPTGLNMVPAPGHEIQMRPRSGMPVKTGLIIANSPGTIDEDYTGEIGIPVINVGTDTVYITHGDRIAQFRVIPVTRASVSNMMMLDSDTDLSDFVQSERGSGGFGSTGVEAPASIGDLLARQLEQPHNQPTPTETPAESEQAEQEVTIDKAYKAASPEAIKEGAEALVDEIAANLEKITGRKASPNDYP